MDILKPASWAPPRGYAYGVVATGRMVFVGGLIGTDSTGRLAGGGFIGQARRALENIVEVLAEAKAPPTSIVRMTWYVVDKRQYLAASKELGQAYRETIGRHYPAMSVVEVSALLEEGALVEIEATAVLATTTTAERRKEKGQSRK
jgi:enamine deaminase RidA (YjgF/YER057c/UK114 family)